VDAGATVTVPLPLAVLELLLTVRLTVYDPVAE
jgi:hypothetical protein